MAPAIQRVPPPHEQVADAIREQITTGTLAVGSVLPSYREAAEQWDVSRDVIARAYATLAAQGLVRTQRGAGTIVTGRPHRGGADLATSVRRTGRIYLPGEYATITAAEVTSAPDDVASVLGLDPESPVIRRARTTHAPDGTVTSMSTSWYDGALAEAAPALLVADRIPAGSWAYLEERTGRRATRGEDRIGARLATAEELSTLGLTDPAAVRVSTTTLWTDDDVVIEYGVSVSRGDRLTAYAYLLGE